MAKKNNRFSSLRDLREERQEEELPIETPEPVVEPEAAAIATAPQPEPAVQEPPPVPAEKPVKRGPGRPPGRRSDPGYTQISAYIPLELLQDVQDALAAERRTLGTRTPRPVSQLVEDLLDEWLKAQQSD